ncbi:MAG: hypothetical protein INH41_18030 [Myxococcaceae bacterium]|nr:hypothetical protein [Myxococcaceae bacterium]MCA3014285.1 hypothetical protein [Myxococcaceae bacterium]
MRPSLLAFAFAALSACGPTIGDPCTTERDCGAGACLNRDFTPGGYCSLDCRGGASPCPAGSICVEDAIGRGTWGCLRSCRAATDCRPGYVCRTEKDSSAPVCVGPEGV